MDLIAQYEKELDVSVKIIKLDSGKSLNSATASGAIDDSMVKIFYLNTDDVFAF